MDKTKDYFLFQNWENMSVFNYIKDVKKDNIIWNWLLFDKSQKIKANANITKNKSSLKQILG